MSEVLVEQHVLEYPGGYTRSVGPIIGRFLTGLRDGRIVGIRGSDGKVLVPPTEYDPYTAAALSEFVDVGPSGVVTAWTWVAEPRVGKQPLDRPFAWALIQLDGADTDDAARASLVDGPDALSVGMRVQPRWRAERVGSIRDIEAFVPEGSEPLVIPEPVTDADGSPAAPVTGIVTPTRLDYEINAGVAPSKYLRGLAEGKVIGQRAVDSDQVYVPPRGSDPTSGAADRDRGRGRRHRDRHHLLCRERARSLGAGAGDPVRLRADPARRWQHTVVRTHPGLARRRRPHGSAGQGDLGRRAASRTHRASSGSSRPASPTPSTRPTGSTHEKRAQRSRRTRREGSRPVGGRGGGAERAMRDVAVVGFAQNLAEHDRERNEVEFIIPVVRDAIAQSGIPRHDIGFTVSGSCDYLSGGPFTFVQGLDAVGAWPPDQGEPRRDGRRVGALRGVGRDPGR